MLGTALYTIVTGVVGTPWSYAVRIREILLYRKLIETSTSAEVEYIACNSVKCETGRTLPPVLKTVTRTLHAALR